METKTVHIIRMLLCMVFCPLWLLTSCINDSGPFADDGAEGGDCFLTLNVGLLETRSGGSEAVMTPCERMHSLRIVVLSRATGTVEYNNHYQLSDDGESLYGPIIIPVKADGKKSIYLIANEEWAGNLDNTATPTTLNDFLESAVIGSDAATFEEDINNVVFTESGYDKNGYIPMSSVYDIETLVSDAGKRKDCGTLHIVRTMTKFSFSFYNDRVSGTPVEVNSWTISGLTDRKAYLMPHFKESGVWGMQKWGDGWIGFGSGWTAAGPEWKDWLAKVSYESNIDPENPAADENGWLTCYSVPSDTKRELTYKYGSGELLIPIDGKDHDGKAVKYYPESKNLKSSPEFAGEQEYFVNLVVTENGEQHTFDAPISIPNLRSLFRNTHVKIHVRFGQTMADDVIYAKIIDWKIWGRVEGELIPEE